MASAKFQGNRFRINGEIAENLTASIVCYFFLHPLIQNWRHFFIFERILAYNLDSICELSFRINFGSRNLYIVSFR